MNFAASIEAAEKNLELYEHRKIGLSHVIEIPNNFSAKKNPNAETPNAKNQKIGSLFQNPKMTGVTGNRGVGSPKR
jgi:hypothetical protein